MFTKCHVYATFDERNIYNSQWPFEDVQRYMYIRNFEVGSKYLETRDSRLEYNPGIKVEMLHLAKGEWR